MLVPESQRSERCILTSDHCVGDGKEFYVWVSLSADVAPQDRIHLQARPERPLIELEPTTHPLSVDYRHGVSVARALELVAPYVANAERV